MPKAITPLEVLKSRGTAGRSPGARKRMVLEPQKLKPHSGIPPESLKRLKGGVDLWRDLFGKCPKAVITDADGETLENMVRLQIRIRSAGMDFSTADIAQVTKLYQEFGMTPASRAKVQIFTPVGGVDKSGTISALPEPEPFAGLKRVV